LDSRLDGSQSRSESGGEEKNSQLFPGLEPPIIQPVAQRSTTELLRLVTKEILRKTISNQEIRDFRGDSSVS
jgi:hypothetical protein